MAVRPIDANAMLNELKPVGFEAEHSAVLLSDVSKMMREWVERQPTLTPPNEPERAGLYGKYTVYKNKDGSLVPDCFVLRPVKDPAAVIALRAYAAATDNAELSADIINWVGAEPNEPLTLEQLREMDGEPVWIKRLKGLSVCDTGWAVVDVCPNQIRVWWFGSEVEDEPSEKDYGETWLAYRCPPEKQEDKMIEIEKLVKQLRHCAELAAYYDGDYNGIYNQAADALEKLQVEIEQAKAERDAAVDADKAILWLKDYVFEDSRKIYTNGARIIPYFRVLQALRDKAYNGLKEDK